MLQMEARNKANAEKIANGEADEGLTDFDIKKNEKEKEVEELRAQVSEVKTKVGIKAGFYVY